MALVLNGLHLPFPIGRQLLDIFVLSWLVARPRSTLTMPALVIFRNFTTRPFGGDDLHIPCMVLGLFRLVQFICLAPLVVYHHTQRIRAKDLLVNNIPPWCDNYFNSSGVFILFVDELDPATGGPSTELSELSTNETVQFETFSSFRRLNFGLIFGIFAIVYLAADVTWICAVWSASSLGTPTETKQRDYYLL